MHSRLFDIPSIRHLSRIDGENEIRARCVAHYLGDHEVIARCLGRFKMFLDTRDVGFAPHMMMDGYWEYWITQFIVNTVKSGFIVLDIGANFGYYSLLLSELIGASGRCIAFEPNPNVAIKLRNTLSINGFHDRTLVQEIALGSSTDGEVDFFIPTGEPKNARVVPPSWQPGEEGGRVIKVRQSSVDKICERMPRLDFVKIDAEGAEEDIIYGMSNSLARWQPSMLVEFNAGRGNGGLPLILHLTRIYGCVQYIDVDGSAKPCNVNDLMSTNVGNDWMLYLSCR